MTRRSFHQAFAAGFAMAQAAPRPAGGGARIGFDPARKIFTLENSRVRKQLRIGDAGGLELVSFGFAGGRNWAAAPGRWGTDIYRKIGDDAAFGLSNAGRFRFLDHEIVPADAEGAAELRLRFEEPGRKIEYTLHTRLFAGSTVLEQWIELRNRGSEPVTVERFDPLLATLALPRSEPCALHYVQGCQDYGFGRGIGTNLQPFGPYRVRRVDLPPDDGRTLLNTAPFYANARRSTSSSENLNWFSIDLGRSGEGIFGGLEWSGEWALSFARTSTELIVHGGVHYCTHNLAPGAALVSPRAFTGMYTGGVDRGVHELHRYLRASVMPPSPDSDFPWTCYNTWYNWNIGLEEDGLKKEAAAVRELGLECFYVDAGWYEGSPERGSFGVGLGSWTENRRKFPRGLAAFGDSIHAMGMRFGIWVEPERVDVAVVESGRYGLRKEWIAARDGTALQRDGTAQLCFGNPDAVSWAKEAIARVVADYRVDWLKWDHNFYTPCNRRDHGHQAGDGGFSHIQGVYEVLAHLRRRFPKLVIENCSGGGNRIDFGIIRFANTSWNSDDTAPSHRVRYQTIGCSYPFPAQYQNSWYIARGEDPVTAASPSWLLDYLFRSRMIGAFGISDHITNWPRNMMEAGRRAVADVKRMRPVLTGGDVYHTLPQPLLLAPPLMPPVQWEAIEYFHPALQRGVILCFRAGAENTAQKLTPGGLDPARRYTIRAAGSPSAAVRAGREWTDSGIEVRLPFQKSSEILWIDAAG